MAMGRTNKTPQGGGANLGLVLVFTMPSNVVHRVLPEAIPRAPGFGSPYCLCHSMNEGEGNTPRKLFVGQVRRASFSLAACVNLLEA